MQFTRKPFIGILSFLFVLFTMPLGHSAMVIMEKSFGREYIFHAALVVGFAGLGFLIAGIFAKNVTVGTFLGLFAGLFVWTGWIEFSFVYYAHRQGVTPLAVNGEIVTKPEYLLMPSSIGFLAVMMIYYVLGNKTDCPFFSWFQRRMGVASVLQSRQSDKNPAMVTFIEFIAILWTFYLLLLFAYDEKFFGEKHVFTYLVAFGSLFWSIYLFKKLLLKSQIAYAVRYAIPTVIIFWNFVEVLGRWNLLKEIWLEPKEYALEMGLILAVFAAIAVTSFYSGSRQEKKQM